jgi:hypothetical protein
VGGRAIEGEDDHTLSCGMIAESVDHRYHIPRACCIPQDGGQRDTAPQDAEGPYEDQGGVHLALGSLVDGTSYLQEGSSRVSSVA